MEKKNYVNEKSLIKRADLIKSCLVVLISLLRQTLMRGEEAAYPPKP